MYFRGATEGAYINRFVWGICRILNRLAKRWSSRYIVVAPARIDCRAYSGYVGHGCRSISPGVASGLARVACAPSFFNPLPALFVSCASCSVSV
jgi:hypothetical protein